MSDSVVQSKINETFHEVIVLKRNGSSETICIHNPWLIENDVVTVWRAVTECIIRFGWLVFGVCRFNLYWFVVRLKILLSANWSFK